MFTTAKLNKIKQDTILKNFWKNNDRFADLFNTFLFNGEEILKPDDLTEVDTDVSSMLKFNGHAETVQKILDVVKPQYAFIGVGENNTFGHPSNITIENLEKRKIKIYRIWN